MRDYVPPYISLANSSCLRNKIENIYTLLYKAVCRLDECKHTELNVTQCRKNGNIVRLLVLCIMNRILSLLKQWINEKSIHPWYFYSVLCQFICELSSMDKGPSLTVKDSETDKLPDYNHFDQSGCFGIIEEKLNDIMQKICTDNNIRILMQKNNSGYEYSAIFDTNISRTSTVYMMLQSEKFISLNKLLTDVNDIKLSASESLNQIIQHALPGVTLTLLKSAPGGLPERRDTIWLKVETHSERWNMIQRTKRISCYWPAAPEDLTIEIVINVDG